MAGLNFPSNPEPQDTYSYNNRHWVWDGVSWDSMSFSNDLELISQALAKLGTTFEVDGGRADSVYSPESDINGGSA